MGSWGDIGSSFLDALRASQDRKERQQAMGAYGRALTPDLFGDASGGAPPGGPPPAMAMPGASPMPPSPGQPSVPSRPMAGGGQVPRGIRNDNPGNIQDGRFAQSQPGYAGSDGRFARFGSMQQGAGAMSSLLDKYASGGANTVRSILGKWAPPGENNTGAYIQNVSQKLGVHPDQPLTPAQRQPLMQAISQFENGRSVDLGGGQPPQGAPGQGGPPQGQPQQGQPQQGGRQQLTWQQVVQAVRAKNPNASPGIIAEAVNQFAPMMTQQSQMDWRDMQMQMRQQLEDGRNDRFAQGEQGKNDRTDTLEQGRNSRFDATQDRLYKGLDLRKQEFQQKVEKDAQTATTAQNRNDKLYNLRQLEALNKQRHDRVMEMTSIGNSMMPDDQKQQLVAQENQEYATTMEQLLQARQSIEGTTEVSPTGQREDLGGTDPFKPKDDPALSSALGAAASKKGLGMALDKAAAAKKKTLRYNPATGQVEP